MNNPKEIEEKLQSIPNIRAFVPEVCDDYVKFSLLFPNNKLFMITIPTSGVAALYDNIFPFTYTINKDLQYQNAMGIDMIIGFIKTVTDEI